MKVGRPLDQFWTVFQQTIGDPAQFFRSQLTDLEVVSLLLHKTNRAEQRQLDSPPLARELWTGPQSASPKGTVMCAAFYLFIFIFAMFYAETEVKMKPPCQRAKKTLRGAGGRETKDGSHRLRKATPHSPVNGFWPSSLLHGDV